MTRRLLYVLSILGVLLVGIVAGYRTGFRAATYADSIIIEAARQDRDAREAFIAAQANEILTLRDTMSFTGIASFYGTKEQGRQTASGEIFDRHLLTAATTLPLKYGTLWRVTRLDTRASVVVRLNDKMPRHPGRVIDLSEAAAKAIGMTREGVVRVQVSPEGE